MGLRGDRGRGPALSRSIIGYTRIDYAILSCTILRYAILYYAILYYTLLHYATLGYTRLNAMLDLLPQLPGEVAQALGVGAEVGLRAYPPAGPHLYI